MKNNIINHISLSFDAISENEAFARMTVAFFMAQLNPTIDQVEDVKTAVSEAVTNAIIHGYEVIEDEAFIQHGLCGHECIDKIKNHETPGTETKLKNSTKNSINNSINNSTKNQVHMKCKYHGRELYVEISDDGVGIQDVAKAMEPLYTSKPQLDRSGMGFSFMEAFMDELAVTSEPGHGTTVKMKKIL